jgi:hypothetical protein
VLTKVVFPAKLLWTDVYVPSLRNLLNTPLREVLDHIRVHLIWRPLGINLDDSALALKLIDHRHARVDKGAEALLDRFNVVIRATRRLAAVQQALLHDGFGAVEEEGEFRGDDCAFESVCLVEFAGEA